MKEILPGIHRLSLGSVNAYLIGHDSLTLIDTGYEGSHEKIVNYIQKIGKTPDQLEQILITHLHTDHAGGMKGLRAYTSAPIYMHPADAKLVTEGIGLRDQREVSPGIATQLIYHLFVKNVSPTIQPFKVDTLIEDQTALSIGKGIQAIHVPGHAAGQLAFLYQDHGGILFAADTCANAFGLGLSPFYEDLNQGKKDLKRLAALPFNHAVFGHGSPLLRNASEKFRKKFAL